MWKTKRERQYEAELYQKALHGYWPRHPFVFMRRWHYFVSSIYDTRKKMRCWWRGHEPVIIWHVDGLPYPISIENGQVGYQGGMYCGGGRRSVVAFCRHCWDNYQIFTPWGNGDGLRNYFNTEFPLAAYIDLSDWERLDIKVQVDKEVVRVRGYLAQQVKK